MFRVLHGRWVLAPVALLILALLPGAGGVAAQPATAPPAQATRLPTDPVPDPHLAGVQWFAPTGHTLRGSFLDYWNRYGGLAQFGYPITEEMTEPGGPTAHLPLTVQYFQRARFEHHPENAGTLYEVELGLLGRELHTPDPRVPAQANPSVTYFPETGHNVPIQFKRYWDAHGGLFVNGYPISEAFNEVNPSDGRTYLVQYFERERFEYHPENAGTPYEVELGLLGVQMALKLGYFGLSSTPPISYPAFGHAPDLSWVAGQVRATRIQGGCVFVQYTTAGEMVAPNGQAWGDAQTAGIAVDGAYVVLFGHKATAGDPVQVCPGGVPYVVDRVQANAGTGGRLTPP